MTPSESTARGETRSILLQPTERETMTKLSAKQERVIKSIKDGCALVRHFDVYGGYWWTLQPTGEKILRATVDALVDAKAIIPGVNKSIYSGYQEMPYALTESAKQ